MSEVSFIRFRGRVIPIKKKDKNAADPVKGSIKASAGAGLGFGSAFWAAKDLKKSAELYKRTTDFRSISKLSSFGSQTYSKVIRQAAKTKLSARTLRNISRKKFGIGLAISAGLISSGVSDFFKKDSEIRDEVSGAVGTAASALIVSSTARHFGIRASTISDLFMGFNRKGRAGSMDKIRQIAKTAHSPHRVRKQTQLKFKF